MTPRRAPDDDDRSLCSASSLPLVSHREPLLPSAHDDEREVRSCPSPSNDRTPGNLGPSPRAVRAHFLQMSALFALNHGCTVACLGLANARLGAVGVWQSGALYASYTVAALVGAPSVVRRLGSRNGLAAGMGMSASYVTSFFLSAAIVAEGDQSRRWLQGAVAVGGAAVGGAGSAILWVSQGTYFSHASQLYVAQKLRRGGERIELEDVTSRLGGNFAFLFLAFEVMLRLLSTFLIETVGWSWKVIFGLYSVQSILPAVFMLNVMDVERYHEGELQHNDSRGIEDDGDDEVEGENNEALPWGKATAAVDLLRNDPKTKFLAPINILFGLSTAFSASVLNGEVVERVLSDPNSTFVGFYTSITSMVAAAASLLFGWLESSTHGSLLHCGKEAVMTIGALSYFFVAFTFLTFPNSDDWNRMTLISMYTLLGVGRATYEGTLRAVFADFFPKDKEGAFANIILFSGTASTIGYILSVTRALECDAPSKFCMQYSDGSVHNVLVMVLAIIAAAIVAIPSFWRAVWLFRMERDVDIDA